MNGSEVQPLDLQRMLVGDFEVLLLVEIAIRTGLMYISALVLVRFLGKRGLGQLSPFEYVIVIAMGSAAGDPMFYPEIPVLHGVVVLASIVLLQKGLLQVVDRSPAVEHFVESVPMLLVQNGRVLDHALRREGISRDELYMKLREAGYTNVGQVRMAFLEPSGAVSAFPFAEDEPRRPGPPTIPAISA